DPGRPGAHLWVDRGQHFPRRHQVRPAVLYAARARLGSVRDSGRRPIPLRRRGTPGRRGDRRAGLQRGSPGSRPPAQPSPELAPMNVNTAADVLIVGAGVIGAATAFHLTRLGAGSVTVLDRASVGSGMSSRSSALVRMHYTFPPEVDLA